MQLNRYYAAIIFACVIWGFIPVLLKLLDNYESTQILYFRLLLSAGLLGLIILIFLRKQLNQEYEKFKITDKRIRWKTVLLTAAGGILLTVNWLGYIYVINNVDVQTASFAYVICPILTALLGFFILKEKLGPIHWFAIFLGSCSCFILGSGNVNNLGYSILIALSYALYLITQKGTGNIHRGILLGGQLLVGALILIPFYSQLVGSTEGLDTYFFSVMLVIALGFTILPLFLNLYSLNGLTSGSIAILMYLTPMFNFLLAFLYFSEEPTSAQLIAYILIVATVIVFNVPNFRRKTLIK